MSVGCEAHTAWVVDRNGTTVCVLDQIVEVGWERVLDEPSPAFVTAGAGGDCCECLGDVRSWHHSLVIAYGGDVVWSGPVVRVESTSEVTTIRAFDVLAWLARRTLSAPLSFVDTDLTDIAEALIAAAFVRDDPGHMVSTIERTGVRDDRDYAADDGYVLDHLRDLAGAGLDVTAIGTRILLLGERGTCRVVGSLSDGDFPDGVMVVEDGLSLATEAIVSGDGVTGRAGGIDPYYGLVQQVIDEDTVRAVGAANAAALAVVTAASPAPVFAVIPDDATLHPNADVNVSDLVPGWCVDVRVADTCRDLSATLRITRVAGGETVEGVRLGITFAPMGIDSGGSL